MSNPFAEGPEAGAQTNADAGGTDVVAIARRALRGRWLIAIACAAAGAVPLGYLGYTSANVEYASSVSIEVLPAQNVTLYDDFRTNTERIREYIKRQDSEITGQRVVAAAVNHPSLRAINWPTNIDGQRELRDSIRLSYNALSTNFVVLAIRESRSEADAALEAVIDTYRELNLEANSPEQLEREYRATVQRYESEIRTLVSSIEAATAEFGTDDLAPLIAELRTERRGYEKQIQTFETEIALREQSGQDAETIDPEELNIEQLAEVDRELAQLVGRRDDLLSRRDVASQRFGRNHPEIEALDRELASVNFRISDRAPIVRERLLIEGPGDVVGGFSTRDLELRVNRLASQVEDIDAELRQLTQVSKDIQRDQDALSLSRDLRDDAALKLSRLDVERQNLERGRIDIAPLSPASLYDDKRKSFALLGFGFGGMLGGGVVLAFGILRPTYRYVDDIDDPAGLPPLLGTLPELERKDPDAERIAAVSVHNLRNTLRGISRFGEDDCQIVVCTSAEPGDGKTTLVQSLGASYALTGLRTIIVDLDLVGGGLSARLGMSGRRGVADLLGGLEPTKCIKRTATEKLYALPAGDASACKPEQLAHRPIQQVADWLRERFDVVIMDTGPVLGSLEAGLAVGVADQVLLVVPRGQSDKIAKASVTRLRRLGADNIGLVFNRADTGDLKQSLSAASIGAPSLQQTQRRIHERRLDQDASIVGSIPPPARPAQERRAAEDGTGP
ncbi:MAG: AAA family ATPase [Planctomycetota bacterium]